MYGEAWDMATNCDEGTVLATQKNLKLLDSRIGAFDDTIRDAIKGSTFGTGGGFIQDGSERANLKIGILGQSDSVTGWANAPTQCVTYSSCHDNLCLYDKLVDTIYGSDTNYRCRYEDLVAMNKLAGAITITSQGIPFMLAGEEFARTKDGDENSYASARSENMIDWNNINDFSDIVEYYRGLYQIRENFAALSDATSTTANNNIKFLDNLTKGVVGYTLNNTEDGKWKKMCIVFNGLDTAEDVPLVGSWVKIADENLAGIRNLGEFESSVTVQPHSAVILVDKTSYDAANLTTNEGTVTVNYYNNDTKELIRKQTITGEIGSAYDISQFAYHFDYDIKSYEGDIQGVFTDLNTHIDAYVEIYSGDTSKVTFKFVNSETGEELTDSLSVSDRVGEQYFTPEIPSINGYLLDTDNLPKNGAGKITEDETEVIYKYKAVSDESELANCIVNAIYMDDSGNIIETSTLIGNAGEEYYLNQNEYEDMHLVSTPENFAGFFSEGEINVIFSYSTVPNPLKDVEVYVFVGAGIIAELCVASVIWNNINRKRKFLAEIDIEE
jgi:hypothetical protein